jgi:hypothetical protein
MKRISIQEVEENSRLKQQLKNDALRVINEGLNFQELLEGLEDVVNLYLYLNEDLKKRLQQIN